MNLRADVVVLQNSCDPDTQRPVLATTMLTPMLAFSPPALMAQSGSTTETEQSGTAKRIEEIVVRGRKSFFRPSNASSATKFDLAIFDTPQAISVVTDDLMNTVQPETIFDVDKYVAGAQNLRPDTGFDPTPGGEFFLRGFTLDGDDGLKINGFSSFVAFRPDPALFDRLEVVKGPTGIVFGVNNFGGVLNLKTKQAEAEFAHELTEL